MCVNFLKYLINFFSTSLIFIDVSRNDCNLITAKMFLTYTIITEKSLIKKKKIVSFVKDKEVVNFIKLKTNIVEIIDIQVGKFLNPADLTSLEVERMKVLCSQT